VWSQSPGSVRLTAGLGEAGCPTLGSKSTPGRVRSTHDAGATAEAFLRRPDLELLPRSCSLCTTEMHPDSHVRVSLLFPHVYVNIYVFCRVRNLRAQLKFEDTSAIHL
jgi:hypothetical protein